MPALRIFILTFFALFLLVQCNVNNNSKESKPASPLVPTKANNYFAGEWKYNNTIWYTSELLLNNNGTFTFHDQGCYGKQFTQGNWTAADDLVVLTSFERFKQNEQHN